MSKLGGGGGNGLFLGPKSILFNFSLNLFIMQVFLKSYLITDFKKWTKMTGKFTKATKIKENS